MKILFLTNNPDVTMPVYEFLKSYGEDVSIWSEKISAGYITENQFEFVVSYNYIHMIREDVLSLLPHKVVNLHSSYLPWNKGFDPNIWSFIENTPSGVTIHEVDKGLDTGDILLQVKIVFDKDTETLRTSYSKLHELMQTLFIENWYKLKLNDIIPQKQIDIGSFHYKKDLNHLRAEIDYDKLLSTLIPYLLKQKSKTDIILS